MFLLTRLTFFLTPLGITNPQPLICSGLSHSAGNVNLNPKSTSGSTSQEVERELVYFSLTHSQGLENDYACRLLPLCAGSFAGSSFLKEDVVFGGGQVLTFAPHLAWVKRSFLHPYPICLLQGGRANAPELEFSSLCKWRHCSSANSANVVKLSFPLNNVIS